MAKCRLPLGELTSSWQSNVSNCIIIIIIRRPLSLLFVFLSHSPFHLCPLPLFSSRSPLAVSSHTHILILTTFHPHQHSSSPLPLTRSVLCCACLCGCHCCCDDGCAEEEKGEACVQTPPYMSMLVLIMMYLHLNLSPHPSLAAHSSSSPRQSVTLPTPLSSLLLSSRVCFLLLLPVRPVFPFPIYTHTHILVSLFPCPFFPVISSSLSPFLPLPFSSTSVPPLLHVSCCPGCRIVFGLLPTNPNPSFPPLSLLLAAYQPALSHSCVYQSSITCHDHVLTMSRGMGT